MDINDVKMMLNLTDEEIHQEYINKTKEASTKMFKEEIEKLDSQPHPYFHKDENMKKLLAMLSKMVGSAVRLCSLSYSISSLSPSMLKPL